MNEVTALPKIDTGTLAILNKSEIDQQIATAHAYPRSVKRFRDHALELATLNEEVAAECMYALPRDGKVIEGPSARLAEILASTWGNCRAGARIVEEGMEFVTAQGVFHDLEANSVITYESKRRITNRKGMRYNADMIATTANAACSIALRNAILKGIPKALWADIYEQARRAAVGDIKTLANKRAEALKAFAAYGVDEARILAVLECPSIDDIGIDELAKLRGIFTAIKEGDITPENAFPLPEQPKPQGTAPSNLDEFAQKQSTTGQGAEQHQSPPSSETAAKNASRPGNRGSREQSPHDPETGELKEPNSPGANPPREIGPPEAMEMGRQARDKNFALKAIPPEWRDGAHQSLADAWQEGWRARDKEIEQAKAKR